LPGRNYQKRLFIGGTDIQAAYRPDVDVILSLGENASKWFNDVGLGPDDRCVDKDEGQQGMNASEIADDSMWVVEYLKAGNRVLVHCSAGMNRSATIGCGVLILMEGMTSEAALGQVRQHHPWARPDPFHWIQLRWLAHTKMSRE
jgi:hypothetical protein